MFVGEEQKRHGIRQLAGADAASVRVAGAGVDQHIVWLDGLAPLLFQIFKKQVAAVLFVEVVPVDLAEAGRIALLRARRHDPEAIHGGRRVHETADIRRLAGCEIIAHEVDNTGGRRRRTQDFERIEPGRFQVEVHGEDFAPPPRELHGRVDQRHRATNAALEGIECRNVHGYAANRAPVRRLKDASR